MALDIDKVGRLTKIETDDLIVYDDPETTDRITYNKNTEKVTYNIGDGSVYGAEVDLADLDIAGSTPSDLNDLETQLALQYPEAATGGGGGGGDATAANQATGNASLGNIDSSTAAINTKTPALGQALAAASTPVVLTAAQITTLTPPAAITGFSTEATLASIKDTAGIKKITDALPAGAAIIGKVGIDQTTPGTTNKVSIGTDGTVAIGAGSAVIGHVIHDSGSTTDVTGNVTVVQGTASNLKVASTLDAETTKVIGTVNISAAQTVATVTTLGTVTNVVHVDDNSSTLSVDWNGTQPVTGSGTATGALRVELPTNGTGVVGLNAGSAIVGKVGIDQTTKGTTNGVTPLGFFVTLSTDVTRQAADTTTYANNDVISDSTSAPTTGGYTFTGAARISGGSGIITDAMFTSSAIPALTLAGELWIFNTAVTNINDNTAFAVSDAEIKTLVAVIPFTMIDAGNNQYCHAQNLSIGFTCSGSANLRFLLRAKNAYIPVGSEVITSIIKVIQID